MSGPEQVFRRIPGEGWLVLAGSNPELGGETADLMERLLERLDLASLIAAIRTRSVTDRSTLLSPGEWLGVETGYTRTRHGPGIEGWKSRSVAAAGDDPELAVAPCRATASGDCGGRWSRGADPGHRRRGSAFDRTAADPAGQVVLALD
jgi:hypothetical protein